MKQIDTWNVSEQEAESGQHRRIQCEPDMCYMRKSQTLYVHPQASGAACFLCIDPPV